MMRAKIVLTELCESPARRMLSTEFAASACAGIHVPLAYADVSTTTWPSDALACSCQARICQFGSAEVWATFMGGARSYHKTRTT